MTDAAEHPPERSFRVRAESDASAAVAAVAAARAAKRKGFVVRRNEQQLQQLQQQQQHPTQLMGSVALSHSMSSSAANTSYTSSSTSASQSAGSSPTATTQAAQPSFGPFSAGPIPRRRHVRGISHDSIMDHRERESIRPLRDAPPTPLNTSGPSNAASSSQPPNPAQLSVRRRADSLHKSAHMPPQTDLAAQPHAYFQRLSVIAAPDSAVFSARVVDSARAVLFALSQVLPAVRQFLAFCTDRTLVSLLTNIIYGVRSLIDSLIRALDHHDALPQGSPAAAATIEPIIHSTLACLPTFKSVTGLVHDNLRSLVASAEIRHTRALFLLMYGTLAEVRNAWTTLLPALAECRLPVASYLSIDSISPALHSTAVSPMPAPPLTPNYFGLPPQMIHQPKSPQHSAPVGGSAGASNTVAGVTVSSVPMPPLTIPTSNSLPPSLSSSVLSPLVTTGPNGNVVHVPMTPLDSSAPYSFYFPIEPSEADEELYERIRLATSSTMAVLELVRSGIVGIGNAESDSKMQELKSMCDVGSEITVKLRERLETIREGDFAERQRFGDETNTFVRVVINFLEYTKILLNDYTFLTEARPLLSSLTKVTKEVLTGSRKAAAIAAAAAVASGTPIPSVPTTVVSTPIPSSATVNSH
ncbi:RAM signaling pathway protein-domain-containing protein [Lipomyces oligophaga]|uniref:RAM signaling pathway protein-domain-containing protein n=1 Tax=Lipomyces oligophaga TaxID=45792 RepID=UPI0034CFCD82